jgi:hypothetical protein
VGSGQRARLLNVRHHFYGTTTYLWYGHVPMTCSWLT